MKTKGLKILVVDDDEDDFLLTKDLLVEIAENNIEVIWAATFEKGLELVNSRFFDLCMVDYLLGAKTGIDFLQAAHESGFKKPIIMLTGKRDPLIDRRAMQQGAADYLIKSELNLESLERAVRYTLDRFDASKRLAASEERYRRIFERTRDIIYITDNTGKFIEVNESMHRILGYSREEILKMNLRDLFDQSETPNYILDMVNRTGEIIDFENSLVAKNGDRKICLFSANVQQDGEGAVIYQGIIRDITKRRKIETDLATAEKLAVTGKVVRMIAHEIRNPLTNIYLSIEQIETENIEKSELELYIDIVKRNLDRINVLITELINSSKPAQLEFGKYAINKIIEDTLEDIKDRILLKGVKIEKYLSADMCDVTVDYQKLKMAILNILVNAVEAVQDDQGVLKIVTKQEDGHCVVEISDNGSGIEPDHIAKIFDPFFSGKPKGTGLGLSTTHHIIHSHNGTIDVASEPGRGTTFTVKLLLK